MGEEIVALTQHEILHDGYIGQQESKANASSTCKLHNVISFQYIVGRLDKIKMLFG